MAIISSLRLVDVKFSWFMLANIMLPRNVSTTVCSTCWRVCLSTTLDTNPKSTRLIVQFSNTSVQSSISSDSGRWSPVYTMRLSSLRSLKMRPVLWTHSRRVTILIAREYMLISGSEQFIFSKYFSKFRPNLGMIMNCHNSLLEAVS